MASSAPLNVAAPRKGGGKFVPVCRWEWVSDLDESNNLSLDGPMQQDFSSNQGAADHEDTPTTLFDLPAFTNEAMSTLMTAHRDYSYQTSTFQEELVAIPTNARDDFLNPNQHSTGLHPPQWSFSTLSDAASPLPIVTNELHIPSNPLSDLADGDPGNYTTVSMLSDLEYYNPFYGPTWEDMYDFVTPKHPMADVVRNLPSTSHPPILPRQNFPEARQQSMLANKEPDCQRSIASPGLDMDALGPDRPLFDTNAMMPVRTPLVDRTRTVDATSASPFEVSPLPDSYTHMVTLSNTLNRGSRKRPRSPPPATNGQSIRTRPEKFQGMSVWSVSPTNNRKLSDAQKAERKRKKLVGTCQRCKRLKQPCNGFKESPYLPCESCRKSKPKAITTVCVLEASLLNIMLFRMGPPVDNPTFPLNFFSHRKDIFYLEGVDGSALSDTLDLELMQDNIGVKLHLKVSRFSPLPGDKLAYEGTSNNIPYQLSMPPYCISDIDNARQSIVDYMRKAKKAYINQLVDKNSSLLYGTFSIAIQSDFTKRPLIDKALDIWAATRLIERTWKICGNETLGIHPHRGRNDPWVGFVPVTPIMDQQLDQVVIREVLVPRRNTLLRLLKEKIYNENARKNSLFEIYLTFFILLNNSEMQVAAEREFAQRYGFSGRFGPRGKYMDAEAQFHAARTILGHFHYICRGNSLLRLSDAEIQKLDVTDKEKKYFGFLKRQIKLHGEGFTSLIRDCRYETTLYFCHQMFTSEWTPGNGYIEELPSP